MESLFKALYIALSFVPGQNVLLGIATVFVGVAASVMGLQRQIGKM